MSNFAVDGLSSGLDTTSIIEQLMEVEAIPVRRLESQRDRLENKVDAWADLDNRLSQLAGAIETIRTDGGTNVLTGQSSNDAVTVTPTGDGAVGIYEVRVDQIAASHQLMSDRFASTTDLVGEGRATIAAGMDGIGVRSFDADDLEPGHYTIEITQVEDGVATILFDGEVHEVSSTKTAKLTNEDGNEITLRDDGEFRVGSAVVSTMVADETTTIAQLAAELNNPAGAAALQIVDTGDESADPFTVVATARTPGSANELSLDMPGVLSSFDEIREATDTIVSLGDGGLEIVRSDVVVDGVVPGMAIDLSGAEVGEELRINVSRDTEAIVANVRTVVDAANSVFSAVSAYGRADPESEQSGLLNGEFGLRRLESELRSAFTAVGSGSIVLGSQIGIENARDGSVTFDEEKFTELLASDYGDVQEFLVGDAENSYLGRITTSIDELIENQEVIVNATTTLDANIGEIEDTIARYERSLETAEAAFRRQFTAMETLLAQLNSQSSFLAGQLGGLSA